MIIHKKNNTNSHAYMDPYRVNRKAENWQGDRVTIEPQTLCYLKEIELKSKDAAKNPTVSNNYAIKIYCYKNKLLTKNNMLSHRINQWEDVETIKL